MIILGTPQPCDASCLPYCAVADSNRNQWRLPDGQRWSRNAADPYPVEIGGYGDGFNNACENKPTTSLEVVAISRSDRDSKIKCSVSNMPCW